MKYNVRYRKLDGEEGTIYDIEIPQAGLNTLDDYAKRLALFNWIYLGATPVNGSSGSVTIPIVGTPPLVTPGGNGVYRLILASPDPTSPTGIRYDTGATYPTCARNNPAGCQPMVFETLEKAKQTAIRQNEIPVLVNSSEQAWRIIEGSETPVPLVETTSMSSIGLLSLALVAWKWIKG